MGVIVSLFVRLRFGYFFWQLKFPICKLYNFLCLHEGFGFECLIWIRSRMYAVAWSRMSTNTYPKEIIFEMQMLAHMQGAFFLLRTIDDTNNKYINQCFQYSESSVHNYNHFDM